MDALLNAIAETGIEAQALRAGEVGAIPQAPGAYALLMHFVRPLDIRLNKKEPVRLPSGWLVYAGSAKGPGGLRARLARHLRAEKRPHWHVDQLTVRADEILALPVADGNECEIVATLLGHPAFSVAVAGFGNTDCAICDSHLLRFRGASGTITWSV
jgi:Uri superfamily endonuclease